MEIRKPIVASQFYPGRNDSCTDEIKEYVTQATPPEALPAEIVAGIVPHAGWMFSGRLAAMVFAAVKQRHEKVNTFVLFGAAHSYFGYAAAVYDKGFWETPLGTVAIDEDLAQSVVGIAEAVGDTSSHGSEHSIEVQMPFVQHLFAGAKILPVLTPPNEHAVRLGEAVGEIIGSEKEKKIVCIGSTDLTHYGPRYGFTPMGLGDDAFEWASNVNDRQFIDLALKLEPEQMLTNAAENSNACGAGAAAAVVAAAKKLGKTKGTLLAYTNSNAVMQEKMSTASTDSVGYAAIVF